MENYKKKFSQEESNHNLEKLRMCHKKQTRLSIMLGPQQSIYSSSSKISEQSVYNHPKMVNDSMSTFPSASGQKIKEIMEQRLNVKHQKSHFEFGQTLGKGRYGCVYVARQQYHLNTGFICAIKVIKKQYIIQQNLLHQLTRQLKIQSFCQHPNLIKLYGYFSTQTEFCLITELATEGNLYRKIKSQKILQKQNESLMSENKVASIVKQICQGVRYLHTLKIIHRDLKPENILIQRDIIKICDFGWAVCAGSTLRNTVCGTPLYISPQLLKGQSYGQKIDLWAIGILAWELYFGKIPFKITSEKDLIKIIQEQITLPTSPTISETFEHFLSKILCKNPKQRLKIQTILQHNFLKL